MCSWVLCQFHLLSDVDTISPASLNLAKLAKESSAEEPVLFLTTAGSDPSQELEEFAGNTVGKQNYYQVRELPVKGTSVYYPLPYEFL